MVQTEIEWLDDNWMPVTVTHHIFKGGKEMNMDEYDDFWASSMGYDNINHLNEYNHAKDMECLSRYGINCKRNR